MNTVARDMVGIDLGSASTKATPSPCPIPTGAFDGATSTQVYEYVADTPKALAELRRAIESGITASWRRGRSTSPTPICRARCPDTSAVTIARFAAGRLALTQADVDAWMADLQQCGAEDDYLFSVNRYCFLGVAE